MIVGHYARVSTNDKEQNPECTMPRTNNGMEIFFPERHAMANLRNRFIVHLDW